MSSLIKRTKRKDVIITSQSTNGANYTSKNTRVSSREAVLLTALFVLLYFDKPFGGGLDDKLQPPKQQQLRAAKTETREWPPGGVAWETGEAAVEKARNKSPPHEGETMSNHPVPFLTGEATFGESSLFHKWLDGLNGIEIGSSAHNGFGLNTRNVDFSGEPDNTYKKREIEVSGKFRRVDIVAPGNQLPFGTSSVDFVLSSHAVEHFHDPIGFMCEAARVVRPGGFIASILPLHGAHPPDLERERTTLEDLKYRHTHPIDPKEDDHRHWQVWMVEQMTEMYAYMNMKVVAFQPKDDKVGNGFSVIVEVPENKHQINC